MDISDLPAFPHDKLGYARVTGSSIKVLDNREISDMMAGPGMSHLTSFFTVCELQFTMHFTRGQEGYFQWWRFNKINHGQLWFKMQFRTGEGLRWMPCFVQKNGIGDSKPKGRGYSVNLKLITLGHPAEHLTEALAKSLLANEGGDAYNIDKLNAMINGEW